MALPLPPLVTVNTIGPPRVTGGGRFGLVGHCGDGLLYFCLLVWEQAIQPSLGGAASLNLVGYLAESFSPSHPPSFPPSRGPQLNMQMSNCNAVLDLYAASSSGPGAGAPRRRK